MISTREMLLTSFIATLVCTPIFGQQRRTYPPFTLTGTYTEYDAKGEVISTRTFTRYESSSGTWRSVGKVGDVEMATLYRRGIGVYGSNSRTMRLIKESDHAPGCPLRTAEELLADPTFVRTEVVLGFTAYVLNSSRTKEMVSESYFVPELGGGTPFKQVSVAADGRKVISEPISVKTGEPAASDVSGPNYPVIEDVPTFNPNLNATAVEKPEAVYPPDALGKGISSTVRVSVTVDESGRVVSARALSGSGLFGEAAVEAAYQASFTPMHVNGRAIPQTGIISYQFSLPK